MKVKIKEDHNRSLLLNTPTLSVDVDSDEDSWNHDADYDQEDEVSETDYGNGKTDGVAGDKEDGQLVDDHWDSVGTIQMSKMVYLVRRC